MLRLPSIVLLCAVVAVGGALALFAGGLDPGAAGGMAGGCLAVIIGAVAAASAWPRLQLFGPAVLRGGAPHVALTFDDGPDPASTPGLLDALQAADARATFFLLADRAAAHPELVRAIAARHEIALHGASHHPWLTLYPPSRGATELLAARAQLSQIAGRPVSAYFRPPFGVTSPRLFESARRAGLTVIWCSVRTGDGGWVSGETVRARCRKAGAGDIVLLHEGPRVARQVLPQILADLAERGHRAVTVSEVLA